MANSSQLPRIAEEKDSPTGSKDLVESGKPELVNKIVRQIQDESFGEPNMRRAEDEPPDSPQRRSADRPK